MLIFKLFYMILLYFNFISMIFTYIPMERKDDLATDAFYERLESATVWKSCLVNIMLGLENSVSTTKYPLRLIDYAWARNVVVHITGLQPKKVHQATWRSPDRKILNQINHVVIDGRNVSSVLDARTFQGPNIGSDD